MRRERNRTIAGRAGAPDVGSSARDLLEGDVPPARDQPARNEIDDTGLGSGGRLNRQQLRGERYDVGHARKLALHMHRVMTTSTLVFQYAPSEVERSIDSAAIMAASPN